MKSHRKNTRKFRKNTRNLSLHNTAVLYINGTLQQALQHHLGSEDHHTVYEAELVGLTLAAALLQQFNFLEDATIAIDNQAAIKTMTNHKSSPGQQLIDLFHNQMSGLAKQH